MKIKALISFASTELTMYQGEVRDCDKTAVISELISAGYVEEVKEAKPKKTKQSGGKK